MWLSYRVGGWVGWVDWVGGLKRWIGWVGGWLAYRVGERVC